MELLLVVELLLILWNFISIWLHLVAWGLHIVSVFQGALLVWHALSVSGSTEGCERLSKQVAHFSQPVAGSLGEAYALTWPRWGAFTSLVLGACRSVTFMFIQLTLKKMGRRRIAVWHLWCH